MRRGIGMALLALLGVVALAYGFRPAPVSVDTATVARGPLTVSVSAQGMTRLQDRFVVSAPVSGHLQRISLRAGDRVTQGTVLARLTPAHAEVLDPRSRALAQARVAAAEAALAAAQQQAHATVSEAEYAHSEYQRLLRLCEGPCVISEDELQRAETRMRHSQAQQRSAAFAVEVARFELAGARTALEPFTTEAVDLAAGIAVRSPVDGQVLALIRESEGLVAAGQPLLEIGDPHRLEVVVDLLSSDAVRVEPGSRVLFERWGGEAVLEGRVRLIEPTGFTKVSALGVEEQRVWVVIDLVSPPQAWQRLGGGYRVEARFILCEAEEILQIPASALFRYQGGWAVFVVEQGRAQRRSVVLGRSTGLRAQILDGVAQGETVILHPDGGIEPGTRVLRRD